MAKKAKKRSKWFWALWGLVAVAGISLFFMPITRSTPKVHWRVPVHVAMPDLPKRIATFPEKLSNFSQSQMPDVNFRDVRKFGKKVVNSIPDLPSLPYEAQQEAPSEPMPLGPTSSNKAPATEPPVPSVMPPQSSLPLPPSPPSRKGHRRIALIIDDMGLAPSLSERATRLPAFVTLSYLPYAPRLIQQAEAAQAKGHDLMLHLPMEPMGHDNPGPGALLAAQNEEEWRVLTEKALHSFDGYIGVNNHMGSKLTTCEPAMRVVLDILRQKKLFFIDSRTSSSSIALGVAHDRGVRTAGRDVFIDDSQTVAAIQRELVRAESVAQHKGVAIAIGHPHAVTLAALERWIPEAQARGFEIVPVRELVQ
ncbi:MAG: divergent polysaccharide deacetylase family protein [Alphaproteobacteria bacterium]|nr:divergent polysaccharide deacetylase family protein [Alphaproteobacteria bacterium]